MRVNVAIKAQGAAFDIGALVTQVEIRTTCHGVGIHLPAGHAEFFEPTVLESEIKLFVGLLLDLVKRRVEESVALHQGEILEIDQQTHPATFRRSEHGAEQTLETEFRKDPLFGVEDDFGLEGGDGHGQEKVWVRDWDAAWFPNLHRLLKMLRATMPRGLNKN